MRYSFEYFCYELYKIDWLRRVSVDEQIKAWQDWYDNGCDELDFSFNGQIYACYLEFLDSEFRDKEYMRTLLNDKEYERYLKQVGK